MFGEHVVSHNIMKVAFTLSHFLAQHQKTVNVVLSKKEIYVTMAVNQLCECRQAPQINRITPIVTFLFGHLHFCLYFKG